MAQNPNELFDVVDTQDRVIGQERRGVVHAWGLWHRAIHVWVFNAAGQLFLQKRSLAKDSSPGLWTLSCSGHVDAGEDYDHAARRELGEELGLRLPAPPARWFKVAACEELGWEFSWNFRTQAEGPFELQPEEIETGEWLGLKELDRRLTEQPEIFCSGFRMLWARVRPELKFG